jgi:hypothetical protein
MNPFTMEQLGAQHAHDLSVQARQKALVASYKGASGRTSSVLSRLGGRLRARRRPATVLVLVPLHSVRTMRANPCEGTEAC